MCFGFSEHLGPVVDSVIKIADTLDELEKSQHSQRVQEQFHRDGKTVLFKKTLWSVMYFLCSGNGHHIARSMDGNS